MTTTRFRSDIKAPAGVDMMYLAEYADGSYITEFHEVSGRKQPYQNLKTEGLIRFGITSLGIPLYVETYGGFIHVAGRNIQVKYVVGNKEYFLIGHPRFYTGIHYLKHGIAELAMSPNAETVAWGSPTGQVVAYEFGYREHLLVDGIPFDFKAICKVPFQSAVTVEFELHSTQELEGEFVILVAGEERYRDKAPIDPETGGKIVWAVK